MGKDKTVKTKGKNSYVKTQEKLKLFEPLLVRKSLEEHWHTS